MRLLLKKCPPLICILLSACANSETKVAQVTNQKTDSVKEKIEPWTTVLDQEDLKIEGYSNIDESMIQSVKVKFEPYIGFEDFPAKVVDTISQAPLDFSTNREAKWYITAIKNGYKEGRSTFGGHYELIMWGCGFPCAHGVIVDRKTGQMIHLPQSEIGYEYRYNSLMLIVNPTDEDGFYDLMSEYVDIPRIYVFDEVGKIFKLLKPGRY